MTETWLSAQGDEAKTVELAPSGFDVKSFPRQSRSRGGGIENKLQLNDEKMDCLLIHPNKCTQI